MGDAEEIKGEEEEEEEGEEEDIIISEFLKCQRLDKINQKSLWL